MLSIKDADKLKDALWKKVSLMLERKQIINGIIDELTEKDVDPMQTYVGTDRIMKFWEDRHGFYTIGYLERIDNDGPRYKYVCLDDVNYQNCAPYLSDTVEAIRQMIDGGKIIENEAGTRLLFTKRKRMHVWDNNKKKWDLDTDSIWSNLHFIDNKTWHVVKDEE